MAILLFMIFLERKFSGYNKHIYGQIVGRVKNVKKFSRLMVKLGFLFPGSECMMPHIVQGAINIPIIHVVDFSELWRIL